VTEPEGITYPLSAWADGHRLTLAWMLDLYSWALTLGQKSPSKLQGAMLVDEMIIGSAPRTIH
jgi:hypothetical protein